MDFHEIDSFDNWWHVDPFVFECVTSEGLIVNYARVKFNAPTPHSVIKAKPYATDGVSMSDYYRFTQVVLFMPSAQDIECDFDLRVKLGSSSSDRAHCKFILDTDNANLSHLMVKKDLHPKLLRWYLLVQNFDFKVRDKGKSEIWRSPLTSLLSTIFMIPSPSRRDGRAPNPKKALLVH